MITGLVHMMRHCINGTTAGVEKVASTIRGNPWECAISPMACRSTKSNSGLPTTSQ